MQLDSEESQASTLVAAATELLPALCRLGRALPATHTAVRSSLVAALMSGYQSVHFYGTREIL